MFPKLASERDVITGMILFSTTTTTILRGRSAIIILCCGENACSE